jgi:type I restriction enzyme S subunit
MLFSEFVDVNPQVKLTKYVDYPFIEMGMIEPGKRYVFTNNRRPFQGGGAKFLPNDILFARITPCLENGKIAQYIDFSGSPGFGSTEFLVFRAQPNISDSSYVYYLCKSDIIRKPAEKSMSGASGRQRANLKSVMDLEVPVLSLPTQRKIASILSAYDDLIENNLRRIKILEEMAQSLYREWFVNFRFPGWQNIRFVDSPLGRIPEGWEVTKLGELIEIKRGKNITKNTIVDGSVPVIAGGKSPAYYHNAPNTQYPVITISASGANAGYVWLHHESIWASDCSFIDVNSTPYIYYYYLHLTQRQFEITRLQRGAAQPHVYSKDLMSLDSHVVPIHILNEFSGKVEPIMQMVRNLSIKNNNLRQTRDLLLPKLISGEIDVSELDIHTPGENI